MGALAGAVYWLAAQTLGGAAAALLALACGALLTGGLHEDGLADCADGFGGGRDPARRLEIMKDSRIGAHGALALILAVGLQTAALGALPAGAGAAALIGAHALSRAALVPVMSALPYARPPRDARVAPLFPETGARTAAVVLAAVALAAALGGLWALCAGSLAAWGAAALLRRGLGGWTGDGLGAAQQLSFTAFLLGAAAWA